MMVKKGWYAPIIPYSVQLFGKLFGSSPLLDEVLDDLELFVRTRLESPRVVEYEPRVGREHELIIDVVVSALNQSVSR